MTDNKDANAGSGSTVLELSDDIESGSGSEQEHTHDPNNKSCYAPIQEKLNPVLSQVSTQITPVVNKISVFFDDEEVDEAQKEKSADNTLFIVTPTRFGAAVVGMTVGTILMGPLIGVACAGAAGYAT